MINPRQIKIGSEILCLERHHTDDAFSDEGAPLSDPKHLVEVGEKGRLTTFACESERPELTKFEVDWGKGRKPIAYLPGTSMVGLSESPNHDLDQTKSA